MKTYRISFDVAARSRSEAVATVVSRVIVNKSLGLLRITELRAARPRVSCKVLYAHKSGQSPRIVPYSSLARARKDIKGHREACLREQARGGVALIFTYKIVRD